MEHQKASMTIGGKSGKWARSKTCRERGRNRKGRRGENVSGWSMRGAAAMKGGRKEHPLHAAAWRRREQGGARRCRSAWRDGRSISLRSLERFHGLFHIRFELIWISP